MVMPIISMEIPTDLLTVLREQPAELSREMRLITAIHFLREKRLSLGQAARFADITRLDFLDVLAARGLPAFDLSVEDATTEIAAAQRVIASDDRQ
jgi:predicted HTH domain antitoxin